MIRKTSYRGKVGKRSGKLMQLNYNDNDINDDNIKINFMNDIELDF